MSRSRLVLCIALFALSVLFSLWFHASPYRVALLAFFCLPPLACLAFAWAGSRKAVFWSGVFGLLWFCHGVMEAWTVPAERGYALVETALAVVIILASSWPGLDSKLGKRRRAPAQPE